MRIRLALPVTLLVLLFVAACVLAWNVRIYGTPFVTENGGITLGDCGFEVWGPEGAGTFCGDF